MQPLQFKVQKLTHELAKTQAELQLKNMKDNEYEQRIYRLQTAYDSERDEKYILKAKYET